MTNILVLVEQNLGNINKASLSAITAAKQYKAFTSANTINVIVLGNDSSVAAQKLGNLDLNKVLYADDSELANYRATAYTDYISVVMQNLNCDVFITAASSIGRDFSARLAARIDAGQASDILAINQDGSFKRPMYAGNAIVDVQILTNKKVITVRPTAFDAATPSGNANTESFKTDINQALAGKVISLDKPQSARPELSDASIVVSGGRALQSAENFEKYIFPLADALGAAIGASRAAVDSGYAPNDWQVGQTGKVVAPQLYLAVGISGAIQHLAGMKDSKVIVAINKDADAPIFEVADYGLVADLYQVVEPLTSAITELKK
jgi:electron transfer flavoprotein alpha subunit